MQPKLDKSSIAIGSLFDRIAPSYDLINTVLSFGIDRFWRFQGINALSIKDTDVVLDIATGTGKLALQALKRSRCRVIGIDISSGMLEGSKKLLEQYIRSGRYLPVRADAINTPFADCSFAYAMICFGIRNMEDVSGFLKEIFRILNHEGILSMVEFSIPANPIIRFVYLFYFYNILPLFGGLISGDFKSYRYFRDSVAGFLSPGMLAGISKDAGFEILEKRPVLAGTAWLYLLRKSWF